MIKRNKLRLIISSIVILLPMLLGFFSGILPEEIVVHWGIDGNADGWMDSTLIFIILPLILLAIHWLCIILTAVLDKNAQENNNKMFRMVFWIIPVISLMSCGVIFMTALGYTSNIYAIIMLILGLSFIFIGNYMPKTTRNITMGIKIRWTLSNDENWNATHRFAGKTFVAIGFLCLLAMPLPDVIFPFVAISIILVGVLLPIIYSYRFYRNQLSEGKVTKDDYKKGYGDTVKSGKAAIIITAVIIAALVIFLPLLMFTGDVEATLGDDALTVDTSFVGTVTVKYEDIESIEYRENGVDGQRISGFGSARLLLGNFKNDEFGAYKRYTYTGDKPCVVLKVKGKTVVVGTDNEQEMKQIYERISAEISK